ncbi:hypothetical protein [Nitratifractor sp.]
MRVACEEARGEERFHSATLPLGYHCHQTPSLLLDVSPMPPMIDTDGVLANA